MKKELKDYNIYTKSFEKECGLSHAYGILNQNFS
ncbi:unnamed protein product, partial [marine sediment metagenome]